MDGRARGGEQAYGSMGNQQGFHGCGQPIPPNATLQFELQLLDWDEHPVRLPAKHAHAHKALRASLISSTAGKVEALEPRGDDRPG